MELNISGGKGKKKFWKKPHFLPLTQGVIPPASSREQLKSRTQRKVFRTSSNRTYQVEICTEGREETQTFSLWWIPLFSRKAAGCGAGNTITKLCAIFSGSSKQLLQHSGQPPAASNSCLTLSCGSGTAVKLCLTLKMQFQALCPLGNTHKCSTEVQTAITVWKNTVSPAIRRAHMFLEGSQNGRYLEQRWILL